MEDEEEMISPNDITVTTPCIYENDKPLWMFLITCQRFGVRPTYYGVGKTYSGWKDIMLDQLMEAARNCPTSHILYTDSRDAFFLSGMDEITEKYNAMSCPKLMLSSDCVGFGSYQAYYDKVPWDASKHFPFFQVGGKLAEARVLCEAIGWMLEKSKGGEWRDMPGDNPPWWCNFMAERPGELTIDHNCEIFQTCTTEALVVEGGRIRNTLTNSLPCILHFNGGFTDQVKGKWYRMEKTWRELGYTENPPWEAK